MTFQPSITDYTATLENPVGVFRTLGEPVFERNLYGELAFRAGNSAAVFTYYPNTVSRQSGVDFVPLSRERRVLKLYVRPNPYLREIYEYVERLHREGRTGEAILPRVRLLRDELFVLSPSGASGWVDVVEGEWIEGATLDSVRAFIGVSSESLDSASIRQQRILRKNVRGVLTGISLSSDTPARPNSLIEAFEDLCAPVREVIAPSDTPARPNSLIEAFEDLCAQLRAAEWAHGDLKPENIVVRPDGTMVLVDCDAMWIPAFADRAAVELGTPPWSARANTPSTSTSTSALASTPAPAPFDKSIDDHPMELIGNQLRHRQ